MKKIVIAPDSYKETLAAEVIADIIEEELILKYADINCYKMPLADGGEGTARIFGQLLKWHSATLPYTTLQQKTDQMTYYYFEKSALFDIASVIGLDSHHLTPLNYRSSEVGNILRQLIQKGFKRVMIGLGGSATVDGGLGLLAGFGYQFFDDKNQLIEPSIEHLAHIGSYKIPSDLMLDDVKVIALSDVDNPLCGTNGATYVFGPQKGLADDQLESVDSDLATFYRQFAPNVLTLPQMGAAGGISACLAHFFKAEVISGVDWILNELKIDELFKNAEVLIVGEGKMDAQSLAGKLPFKLLTRAKKVNPAIKVIAINGLTELNEDEINRIGLSKVYSCVTEPQPIEQLKQTAAANLRKVISQHSILEED